jgi:cell division control protein 7
MPVLEEDDMPSSKRRKLTTSSQTTAVQRRQKKYVALKKIYVTSSPHRILNELELLHDLRGNKHICPLLTAFRHQDQVVAVLPYFRHLDFRLYYHKFIAQDIRHYMYSLLKGLEYVHQHRIIHRDIKPTNFLYDFHNRQGQLVDFGLAEKEGVDWQHCMCREDREKRKKRFLNSFATKEYMSREGEPCPGLPKHDNRPARRANRAGTRGFRAPEVLFKCTAQTTKIDIWSTGVILLTILGRRFPFFNSSDDIDATIEMATIFGERKMQGAAAAHGQLFETTIPIGEKGFTLEKIVRWASCRDKSDDDLHDGEIQAVEFLGCLLELDPYKRYSATEALQHPFITDPIEDEYETKVRLAAEAGNRDYMSEDEGEPEDEVVDDSEME